MRTAKQIKQIYDNTNTYQQITRFQQSTQNHQVSADHIDEALNILGINSNHYRHNIPTFLKRDYVQYHMAKTEFEFHPDNVGTYAKINDAHERHKLLELANLAYDLLLKQIPQKPDDRVEPFSRNSRGLVGLVERTPFYAQANQKQSPKKSTETQKHVRRSSMVGQQSKPGGVEPGVVSYMADDMLRAFHKHIGSQQERLDIIRSYLEQKLEPQDQLDKFIHEYARARTDFAKDYKKYMVKLSYDNPDKKGKVQKGKEDLQRSKTLKRIYEYNNVLGDVVTNGWQIFEQRNFNLINKEAVLEALSNDVARSFGMRVQNQELMLSYYDDGSPRLLLKGEWLDNAEQLGPISDDYMVDYYSDGTKIGSHRVKNLGESLPLFIIQDDFDAINGGENKLMDRLTNELLGIDFGHTYPAKKDIKQTLVGKIDDGFYFNDPGYKTYSVFYDRPRREFMKGVLIAAKLSGQDVDHDIVKSYGDSFYQRWLQIQPGGDYRVFTAYRDQFKKLCDNDPQNQGYYRELIDAIHRTELMHQKSRNHLVDKFVERGLLNIPAEYVDAIEAVDKAIAAIRNNASLRSTNGEVLLNHIRIKDTSKRPNMYVEYQSSTFFLVLGKQLPAKQVNNLNDVFNEQSLVQKDQQGTYYINLTQHGQLLKEETVKQKYFPEDYNRYRIYTEPARLNAQIEQLQTEIKQLTQQLETTQEHYNSSTQCLEHVQHRVETLEKEKKHLQDEKERVQKQYNKLNQNYQDLNQSYLAEKFLREKLQEQSDQVNQKIRERNQQLEKDNQTLKDEKNKTKDKLVQTQWQLQEERRAKQQLQQYTAKQAEQSLTALLPQSEGEGSTLHLAATYQNSEAVKQKLQFIKGLIIDNNLSCRYIQNLFNIKDQEGYTAAQRIAWHQTSKVVWQLIEMVQAFSLSDDYRNLPELFNSDLDTITDNIELGYTSVGQNINKSNFAHRIARNHDSETFGKLIHLLVQLSHSGLLDENQATCLVTIQDYYGCSIVDYLVNQHQDYQKSGELAYELCQNFKLTDNDCGKIASNLKDQLGGYIRDELEQSSQLQAMRQITNNESQQNHPLRKVFLCARNPLSWMINQEAQGWINTFNNMLQGMKLAASNANKSPLSFSGASFFYKSNTNQANPSPQDTPGHSANF